jgi:hypothetical protein
VAWEGMKLAAHVPNFVLMLTVAAGPDTPPLFPFEARGILRTNTRPTLNIHLLLRAFFMSIHLHSKSCSIWVPVRFLNAPPVRAPWSLAMIKSHGSPTTAASPGVLPTGHRAACSAGMASYSFPDCVLIVYRCTRTHLPLAQGTERRAVLAWQHRLDTGTLSMSKRTGNERPV